MMNKYAVALVTSLAISPVFANQTCVTGPSDFYHTPVADFTVNGDGTVTHTKTGLMWRQCPYKTTVQDGECKSEADSNGQYSTWEDALSNSLALNFAGHSDWRLPNITELASIIEYRCNTPARTRDVFPDLVDEKEMWSSTTLRSSPDKARGISMDAGEEVGISKLTSKQFYVVRDVIITE